MECFFCKKPKDIVYKDSYWCLMLDTDQTYLGRCCVVLKRHCGDLAELTKEELLDFHEIAKKLESALKKSFNATMFNWTCLMNDSYKNIPPNPHVHWHFRPRYNHKVEFSGLTFEDKEFAHHYARGTAKEISEDIRKKIIEKIKDNF